jgi:hypothetical protein
MPINSCCEPVTVFRRFPPKATIRRGAPRVMASSSLEFLTEQKLHWKIVVGVSTAILIVKSAVFWLTTKKLDHMEHGEANYRNAAQEGHSDERWQKMPKASSAVNIWWMPDGIGTFAFMTRALAAWFRCKCRRGAEPRVCGVS